MEKKIWQGYLYDFYGELLNERQRRIYEEVVLEDLSLGETAAIEGISRQGVHDMVRRCSHALQDYEAKLHLVEKFLSVRDSVGQIRGLCVGSETPTREVLSRIARLSDEILEEL